MPIHVDSHPERHKPFTDFTAHEWGNYIADRAAGDHLQDLDAHGLTYHVKEITARRLLNDLPPTGMWYWGDDKGDPLPLLPLHSFRHEALHAGYIKDRDEYRSKLPTPLPRYWYDNSLRYAAKVFDMKKCSSSSLSTRIRIVMNKGWHGGNRIKPRNATADDGICYLCGADDSQTHWLHHCSNMSLKDARQAAIQEIQSSATDVNSRAITTALLTVLHTTDQPERIWTANWSQTQIDHLEALLLQSQGEKAIIKCIKHAQRKIKYNRGVS